MVWTHPGCKMIIHENYFSCKNEDLPLGPYKILKLNHNECNLNQGRFRHYIKWRDEYYDDSRMIVYNVDEHVRHTEKYHNEWFEFYEEKMKLIQNCTKGLWSTFWRGPELRHIYMIQYHHFKGIV